jgi:hypothetical protein
MLLLNLIEGGHKVRRSKHELRSFERTGVDVEEETEATEEAADDLFTNLETSQSSHMVMDDPISE